MVDIRKVYIALYILSYTSTQLNSYLALPQSTSFFCTVAMKRIRGDEDEAIRVKRDLVAVTDAVRKKFNSLKSGRIEKRLELEKKYEPITKPLKTFATVATTPPINAVKKEELIKTESEFSPFDYTDNVVDDKDEMNNTDDMFSISNVGANDSAVSHKDLQVQQSFANHLKNLAEGKQTYDTIFGIRIDPDKNTLKMGNYEVDLEGEELIFSRHGSEAKRFTMDEKLLKLIFKKKIQGDPPRPHDLTTYREILLLTESPFRNYNAAEGLEFKNWKKFEKIISPLISEHKVGRSLMKIPTSKTFTTVSPNFVYWNKPKELVDRLRLLWSSKQAGHGGLDNEIISLIEELREEGIIY